MSGFNVPLIFMSFIKNPEWLVACLIVAKDSLAPGIIGKTLTFGSRLLNHVLNHKGYGPVNWQSVDVIRRYFRDT